MALRIVSWNVNSLRSALEKGFLNWMNDLKPDIICLQEVRATEQHLRPLEPLFPGYRAIWNPAIKPGYAGTAVLSRFEPLSSEKGLCGQADPEGRSLTVDFGDFYVGSFYAPNATPNTPKIPIKQQWLNDFTRHVAQKSTKPFFLCGDLNVAHSIYDSQNTPHPRNMNGCTPEERKSFQTLFDACDLIDPTRIAANDAILSTWWDVPTALRSMKNGVRYDYILLQKAHSHLVAEQKTHHDIGGSDHCPVSILVALPDPALKQATGSGQVSLL